MESLKMPEILAGREEPGKEFWETYVQAWNELKDRGYQLPDSFFDLGLAIVLTENSQLDPRALGPTNDVGYFQITYPAILDVENTFQFHGDPWNPKDNIKYGLLYLFTLFHHYDIGRGAQDQINLWDLARAYHVGPKARKSPDLGLEYAKKVFQVLESLKR
jgi:hypothetical protein